MKYFMGIDVSTTSSKVLIINSDGSVIGVQSLPYALSNPQPLWSEQDPEDWWWATVNSIHAVLAQTGIQPGDIVAVGLTGQMHGLVLLDVNGKVLRPAILWNDQRTQSAVR